jgi:copper chaperone CopZ
MNTFAISGMTCAVCADKVEKALRVIAPQISVTLNPAHASVPKDVPLANLNAVLSAVGHYRLSELAAEPATDRLASNYLTSDYLAWFKTYYPLFLIIALCAVIALASANWMMGFMAAFYIAFGAFKLLDVPAFARSFSRYDIIAKRVPLWGYVYPFVELALGFGFLFYFQMTLVTWIALVTSLIGAIGVIQSVRRKETIQCACLGTVFQLPMSTVTIVENLGMAAMAAWMLYFGMSGMAPGMMMDM